MNYPTRIYSANIKDPSGVYLNCACVLVRSLTDLEYTAMIEDGNKPKPYFDEKTFKIVIPDGEARTIVRRASSGMDALEQLHALADQYGTLQRGAPVAFLDASVDLDDLDEPDL